ncbi:MAG: hypothetical protein JW932_01185 [Deltaproteobacteria bacterium]|nr:hypothetical protein [Deltaproteobacteria bacterium]
MKILRCFLERKDIICLLILSLVFLSFLPTSSFEKADHEIRIDLDIHEISVESSLGPAFVSPDIVEISSGLSKEAIAVIAAVASMEAGIDSILPDEPLSHQLPTP